MQGVLTAAGAAQGARGAVGAVQGPGVNKWGVMASQATRWSQWFQHLENKK